MSREADHRLPRTVIPRRYDLVLEPDLSKFTFAGSEVIRVEVIEPVEAIVLNAIEIDIDSAGIGATGDGGQRVADVAYDTDAERAILTFAEPVQPGTYELRLEFRGVLNDRLHGFYRSTYTDGNGVERALATTQFEATDARRAFPCWDEPDLKAVFGVTLIVPDGMMGISCGPIVEETPTGDGRSRVVFGDTMPLSTYLLAFIVGDLEATDPVDVDGVPLRVVHTPGKGHLTAFALEVGAHALRYFADYYEIPYPADKLDMIAIPDFSAGAMENLGAVTYRETALLVDSAQATQAELERVALVIAHELAHMWFGDLVTMRWWNGTWLKEAFATFMEMKCTDDFRPEWKTWLAFAPTRDSAMEIDALTTTRSVEFPVGPPADATAMFDTITYQKGSAVLRMLEQYLGEDSFRRGIVRYLMRHAYANAETSDLWDALEAASGEPVRAIADDWIFQGGFPRVHVDAADGGVRLTHGCFRYLGDAPHTWKVPVRYRTGAVDERVLVDGDVIVRSDEPVIVNAGGSGFYRTRYGPELMEPLVAMVNELGPDERFSLVADTWASVLAGDVAASGFIELASAFGDETEPAVWQAVLGGLAELDRIVSSDDRPRLQALVRRLVGGPAGRLGWQPRADESDLVRRLRGLILGALGGLGDDAATQREAAGVVEQWLGHPESVDGDVATAALGIVAGVGDRRQWERFLQAWRSAASPQAEVRFLRAAAAVPDTGTAVRMLDMVLNGEIRRQDSYWVLARLLGHRDTGIAVWNAVKDRWDEVIAAMPPQNARRMLDLIHYRSEPDVAADIKAWLVAHPIKGVEQLVAQQLERLEVRAGLRSREQERLSGALGA